MKNKWYGDQCDLIKWAGVFHLAGRGEVSSIVQIAFFNDEGPPAIEIDGRHESVQGEVWTHFRDIHRIKDLRGQTHPRVSVFDPPFKHKKREKYVACAINFITQKPAPRIVLLDPDNGIGPQQLTEKHVSEEEIGEFWQALGVGDWLVCYQHRWRHKCWKHIAQSKCKAKGTVNIEGPQLATDVALFALRKK